VRILSRRKRDDVLDDLSDLIFMLDAYRINRYVDLRHLDRIVKEGRIGKNFTSKWKNIRHHLYKKASIPTSLHKSIVKLINIRTIIRIFGQICSISLVILYLLGSFFRISLEWVGPIFTFNLFGIATSMLLTVYFNRKIALKVDAYQRDHPREYRALKGMIQNLIFDFSNRVKLLGVNPKEHLIKVYNTDYKGIRIIKKPSFFRKHYIVEVYTNRVLEKRESAR